MANPRVASIRAARTTTRELAQLFARIGTADHPRGQVLSVYRNTRRALRDVFGRSGVFIAAETREVLAGLRRDVAAAARDTLRAAVELGTAQGDAELEAWGLGTPGTYTVDTGPALASWLAMVDQQATAALAIVASGGDTALVVGDERRAGFLQPSPVAREGARWLVVAAMMGLLAVVRRPIERSGIEWYKQAIAAIDARTTDCCLRVHGQAVPLNSTFRLRGEPRFADRLDWSPFHWRCRTSVALVPASQVDDELTQRLLAQGRAEIGRRDELTIKIRLAERRLGRLGATPDTKARRADTKAVTELRGELRELRRRLGG